MEKKLTAANDSNFKKSTAEISFQYSFVSQLPIYKAQTFWEQSGVGEKSAAASGGDGSEAELQSHPWKWAFGSYSVRWIGDRTFSTGNRPFSYPPNFSPQSRFCTSFCCRPWPHWGASAFIVFFQKNYKLELGYGKFNLLSSGWLFVRFCPCFWSDLRIQMRRMVKNRWNSFHLWFNFIVSDDWFVEYNEWFRRRWCWPQCMGRPHVWKSLWKWEQM